MKTTVFLAHSDGEWFYMWDGNLNGQVPMLWNLNKNSEYPSPENLTPLGEIDVLEFTETIRNKIGDFLRHYETHLTSCFDRKQKTKIIFGRDGRIYTFRKPEDILRYKVTPVRLGYFFDKIPTTVLIAWEKHLALCRAKPIITTDAKVWHAAYRNISSCMQNRKEIEFYIENPQAFEIAALYDEQEDQVYARAVVYKTEAGNKYYYRIYSNTSSDLLERYLKEQGVEYIPSSGNCSLPICIARSSIGIPYLDAFYYGTLFDEKYENDEYIYKLILHRTATESTNVHLQFVHNTQSLLEYPCLCTSCELLYPEEFMCGELCENCAENSEDEYCVNCGYALHPEELIYRDGEGYCYDCYRELFTIECEFCGENIEYEDTPVRPYHSIWLELFPNVDLEYTFNQRKSNRETICLDCFRDHLFDNNNRTNFTFSQFTSGAEKEDTEKYWLEEKLITIEIKRPRKETIIIPLHETNLHTVLQSEAFMNFLRKLHSEIQ